MAKLVGVFAASHGPMIAREWDSLTPPTRKAVTDGFERTGERMMETKPDALVIVSPDHWCNFFLNNFPAFCVGIGEERLVLDADGSGGFRMQGIGSIDPCAYLFCLRKRGDKLQGEGSAS